MNARAGCVVSVAVGRIAPLGPRAIPSGIVKTAVDGPVRATAAGLDGDQQADRQLHGGVDKAIYGYAASAYPRWAASMPHHAGRFVPHGMGENLTISDVDETLVHIGDRVRVGTALLQVTEPRQPCFKLGLRFGDQRMIRMMTRNGYCGWYYRTLEPGVVAAGDAVTLVDRPNPDWPVSRFFQIIVARAFGGELLAEMLAIEGLSGTWKIKALQRLAATRDGL